MFSELVNLILSKIFQFSGSASAAEPAFRSWQEQEMIMGLIALVVMISVLLLLLFPLFPRKITKKLIPINYISPFVSFALFLYYDYGVASILAQGQHSQQELSFTAQILLWAIVLNIIVMVLTIRFRKRWLAKV